jgi:hypothetical protein
MRRQLRADDAELVGNGGPGVGLGALLRAVVEADRRGAHCRDCGGNWKNRQFLSKKRNPCYTFP